MEPAAAPACFPSSPRPSTTAGPGRQPPGDLVSATPSEGDLVHESEVVWLEDRENFDYVRQSLDKVPTRKGCPRYERDGRLVGYANLQPKAKPTADSGLFHPPHLLPPPARPPQPARRPHLPLQSGLPTGSRLPRHHRPRRTRTENLPLPGHSDRHRHSRVSTTHARLPQQATHFG